jgi:diguanylate cyclase (GGDEF)-like protein
VRELFIKATHDGLTRLLNHKQGEILLKAEMERVRRNRQPLTVVMMDLDHFKNVNDTYGHRTGDMVLQTVGALLTKGLRKCDIISRFGGEEFLLGLVDTDLEGALEVTRRLKDSIQFHDFSAGDGRFTVTVSMGVIAFDALRHTGVDRIIGDADDKLYHAKNNGRNRIVY